MIDKIDKSLETARKLANMTQGELAEKAQVKRSKIAMVETGERELNTSEVKRIASALGVAPCFLLSENPEETFKCKRINLGFSAPTIETIQGMDDEVRLAFEYLINDPIFGLEIASFFFPAEDEGLHKNGQQVAKASDDITLGSYGRYGGGCKVEELIEMVKSRELVSTLVSIKRRIRR